MAQKRARKSTSEASLKAPKFDDSINQYNGYYPEPNAKVDCLKLSNVDPQQFFQDYVLKRVPVVIDGIVPGLDISKLQPDNIVNTLQYDGTLLVEKKDKGGFGSGTQRIQMKFDELMEKMKKGDDYYLTTQYEENGPGADDNEDGIDESDEDDQDDEDIDGFDIPDDAGFSDTDSIDMNDLHDDFDDIEEEEEEEEDNYDGDDNEPISQRFPDDPLFESEAVKRVQELVQRPLTNLIKTKELPLRPKILETLAPQQINLWMGSSSSSISRKANAPKINKDAPDLGLGRQIFGGGASSGLHHDHSDNLYVPIKGSKRFTIFAPSDGVNLYTVGDISQIYNTGVIDYKTNENAPTWRRVRDDGAIITEAYKWAMATDPKVYEKFDKMEILKAIEKEEEGIDWDYFNENGTGLDPPSFSKIPAAIVHLDKIENEELRGKLTKLAHSKWPNFFKCQRLTVDLKPGQMFYLPAGWFHEVTSFGESKSDKIHIALNYWYSPPNGTKKAYKDKYWKEDFARTKESCELFKQGVVKI